MTTFRKWLQFTKERFEPGSHSVMIALFVIVHSITADVVLGASTTVWRFLAALAFASLFFFKLRLFDEIKDYETDLEINPTRPLARGLLTVAQVKRAFRLVIALELLILIPFEDGAFFLGVFAIAYSLLMYREFFIGSLLRPHLTTYAVSHTVVCSFLSATLLAVMSGTSPLTWESQVWAFIVANWLLFNVFELGRKTFATSEERERVPSYSLIFGRSGAVTLVMIQALAATALYAHAFPFTMARMALIASVGVLLLSGVIYVVRNDQIWGSRYRAISSVYIVLAFLSVLLVRLSTSVSPE